MQLIHRVVVGLLALFSVAEQSHAGLIIDAGPSSSSQVFLGGDYVAGSEFTTTSALTIRSLGWLDVEGDGLLGTHQVGLWDVVSMSLLASVDVASTSATILSAQGTAQWFMENIGPVTIAAGTYRVAGLVGASSHLALSGDKIGNGVTLSSGYVRTDFPSGGFNYPGLSFTSQAVRATLSTDFVGVANAVPEPSTLAMCGIGLSLIAIVGVCRKKSSVTLG